MTATTERSNIPFVGAAESLYNAIGAALSPITGAFTDGQNIIQNLRTIGLELFAADPESDAAQELQRLTQLALLQAFAIYDSQHMYYRPQDQDFSNAPSVGQEKREGDYIFSDGFEPLLPRDVRNAVLDIDKMHAELMTLLQYPADTKRYARGHKGPSRMQNIYDALNSKRLSFQDRKNFELYANPGQVLVIAKKQGLLTDQEEELFDAIHDRRIILQTLLSDTPGYRAPVDGDLEPKNANKTMQADLILQNFIERASEDSKMASKVMDIMIAQLASYAREYRRELDVREQANKTSRGAALLQTATQAVYTGAAYLVLNPFISEYVRPAVESYIFPLLSRIGIEIDVLPGGTNSVVLTLIGLTFAALALIRGAVQATEDHVSLGVQRRKEEILVSGASDAAGQRQLPATLEGTAGPSS